MSNRIIYFDNAATGYPKPRNVINSVYNSFTEYGGNPGRSGHKLSIEASRAVYKCRETVCGFLNFDYPERVVFTNNATYALNIAINGLAEKGSNIIISNLEHNSVYRPVYSMCQKDENKMSYTVFDASCCSDDIVVRNFESALSDTTKLAVITAASNVCGKILPIDKIVRISHKHGVKVIIDASQLLGHMEFDFKKVNPDVVCSSGHKGLYGPVGTGIAVFSKDAVPATALIQGGNGLVSASVEMGNELPEMLEAGTLNTVGICGLNEGIKFISDYGIEKISAECNELDIFLRDSLLELGAIIYSDFESKTPITLFNFPGISPEKITDYLDSKNICTRGGIHCAPLAHKALKTGNEGAVRVSLGYANTKSETKTFLSELEKFLKSNKRDY